MRRLMIAICVPYQHLLVVGCLGAPCTVQDALSVDGLVRCSASFGQSTAPKPSGPSQ